ncbi:MAG: ATP:cob(I)alamin adenosyltransferase [Elusimicrobia bacterium CG1_02_63_36]|nr:MAG: ATP:cob(I)alamin adenosyltransferase [Elusimicrobia bacterium CG1_02_63_36]PIP82790.1 MAG: ATP:cob(I)alamin adenosyltransferase [Elusimicrobia bacterium CG22_combo_CG10-13_8_21_14_all_63_91]PJA16097.1 MAG: ATP:cob(I)alamin adenosyltransferase [Elusimicrobia bacterium CG_4_10_14_0_2_um_filter_63_34]PJB24684.1 MAG: ATP:cob(I)alamin adenosyltransferase [Elusimicrobia bacterium CG_4_9_14_3_um_filter_62_55]
MKIYTKTGDAGETGLRGGKRVAKHHPRVGAYGEIDELNCAIGAALAQLPRRRALASLLQSLTRIQNELFVVGAILSAEKGDPDAGSLPKNAAAALESEIDRMDSELPELRRFILPGGSPAGAALHTARAACRRAERTLCALGSGEYPPEIEVYVNRLSDYLFTAARWTNRCLKQAESPWTGLR